MLELVSTIATLTSTFIDLLNVFDTSVETDRKPRKPSNGTRETEKNITNKVNALLLELRSNQGIIRSGLGASIFIWFFSAFVLFLWLSSSRYFTETVAWIIGISILLSFAVLLYGVLLGVGKFLVERKLNYYSFKEDSFLQLKLRIKKNRWNNRAVEWFIEQILLEVQKNKKW